MKCTFDLQSSPNELTITSFPLRTLVHAQISFGTIRFMIQLVISARMKRLMADNSPSVFAQFVRLHLWINDDLSSNRLDRLCFSDSLHTCKYLYGVHERASEYLTHGGCLLCILHYLSSFVLF